MTRRIEVMGLWRKLVTYRVFLPPTYDHRTPTEDRKKNTNEIQTWELSNT